MYESINGSWKSHRDIDEKSIITYGVPSFMETPHVFSMISYVFFFLNQISCCSSRFYRRLQPVRSPFPRIFSVPPGPILLVNSVRFIQFTSCHAILHQLSSSIHGLNPSFLPVVFIVWIRVSSANRRKRCVFHRPWFAPLFFRGAQVTLLGNSAQGPILRKEVP